MHERVQLNEAINLCKALEPYNLFFLEDPFPPEDNAWFRQLRQHTSIPIAMGELFNTVQEYLPLISERLIDFIRIHISQIGGLSPARKVAALCEFFGVRTAWHGPGDASPVAHAAQLALELATYNFGIHEGGDVPDRDARGVQGLAGAEERLHGGQRRARPRRRRRREARGEVPDSRRAAQLRLLVGHDAAQGRHGDPPVGASDRSGHPTVVATDAARPSGRAEACSPARPARSRHQPSTPLHDAARRGAADDHA